MCKTIGGVIMVVGFCSGQFYITLLGLGLFLQGIVNNTAKDLRS